MNWRDWKAMRRRVWRAKLLRRGLMLAALLLAGCDITWPTETRVYQCIVVDSLPPESARDTAWVKCADPGGMELP